MQPVCKLLQRSRQLLSKRSTEFSSALTKYLTFVTAESDVFGEFVFAHAFKTTAKSFFSLLFAQISKTTLLKTISLVNLYPGSC